MRLSFHKLVIYGLISAFIALPLGSFLYVYATSYQSDGFSLSLLAASVSATAIVLSVLNFDMDFFDVANFAADECWTILACFMFFLLVCLLKDIKQDLQNGSQNIESNDIILENKLETGEN